MKQKCKNEDWFEIQLKADREAVICLTESERKEYEVWPSVLNTYLESLSPQEQKEFRKLLSIRTTKSDAMHTDHLLPIDITVLERSVKPEEYGDYALLADAISAPDYLELMEHSKHDEERICRFHDEQLEESYWSLKEKQREVVNWSVIHDIKTADIALHTKSSQRNIRQLRQRGMQNLRSRYVDLLWELPYSAITHGQYSFLLWVEDGMPKIDVAQPVKPKKAKTESLEDRYNNLCGPCLSWEPSEIEDTATAESST